MSAVFFAFMLGGLSLSVCALEIHDTPIFDDQRLALTRDYCRVHYGQDDALLHEPKMIVVHYTSFPTLEKSFACFAPNLLTRTDIRSGGDVNISAHFLVDVTGAIYRLAPEDVVCRHAIGFNHVALGIENVGHSPADLTEAQLIADAALIDDLLRRYPGIEYLIGHYEYQDRTLPHFALALERDSNYRPTIKADPGPLFMERLRTLLWNKYQRKLKS